MRKIILIAALALSAATSAQAGGYLTNTNQSVSFLRNPARDAVIAIDGAYANPAGLGFMSTGWHLGFDLQSAYQTRTDKAYFPPFALGQVNGVHNTTGSSYPFVRLGPCWRKVVCIFPFWHNRWWWQM